MIGDDSWSTRGPNTWGRVAGYKAIEAANL
jgi:hypothetical protein